VEILEEYHHKPIVYVHLNFEEIQGIPKEKQKGKG
jgi:hypothetical protein